MTIIVVDLIGMSNQKQTASQSSQVDYALLGDELCKNEVAATF
ncbi:MAG TPA: hypothetical protein PKL83_07125 [bacterium]|nr:hypothetical protein [bacterium]